MAREFVCIADPDVTEYRNYTIANQAFTIGDSVDVSRTAGTVIPSTSSSVTYGERGIAMATVTNTATVLLVALTTPRQRWMADTTNTANVAHNGQRMVLTDKGTVNNTGTDSTTVNGLFEQIGVVSTNRIVGRFVVAANITA